MTRQVLGLSMIVLTLASCSRDLVEPRSRVPDVPRSTVTTGDATSIGSLGGGDTRIIAMNKLGQAVGTSLRSDGIYDAFLWTPGVGMQDLGTLDGGRQSQARGINSSGQVVGWSMANDGHQHAFLWTEASGMVDLGSSGSSCMASAINDGGLIAGYAYIGNGSRAVVWHGANGPMEDLGTLGGIGSSASDINASGQVVGAAMTSTSGAPGHAFLKNPGAPMQDLGTLGGDDSEATGINDAGQVVGMATIVPGKSTWHAFIWTVGATMQDLGTLTEFGASEAEGINAAGHVVGWASGASGPRVFLWTPAEGMVDVAPMPDLGARPSINDNNQIALGDLITQISVVPNQPPVAAALEIGVLANTSSPVTLAGTDPESGALTYAITSSPQHGTLSGSSPSLIYTPAAGYLGGDEFSYTVTDPKGLTSAVAMVGIVVVPSLADYTPPGANIPVTPIDLTTGQPSPVQVTFGSVSKGGTTTVTSKPVGQGNGGPPAPGDFRLGSPPTAYDINSDATYPEGTKITVCITWTQGEHGSDQQEANLKLLHRGATDWTDVTTRPGYPDVVHNVICGDASSLSWFVVAGQNFAPVVTAITLPSFPSAVGAPVQISASFTDQNPDDPHTSTIVWGDGTSSAGSVSGLGTAGAVTGTHTYIEAGVYTIQVTVDDQLQTGTRSSALDVPGYVVVYDPSAGFVTGGGWIVSPPGALTANPSLTGKSTFGFVAKYLKGAQTPSGNAEFQFKEGNFNFSSTSYDWLVVGGARAQFKGLGTINGQGQYAFLLTAIDGQMNGGGGMDRLRLKVWRISDGVIVYDNESGAADDASDATGLGGGSIVIHP